MVQAKILERYMDVHVNVVGFGGIAEYPKFKFKPHSIIPWFHAHTVNSDK